VKRERRERRGRKEEGGRRREEKGGKGREGGRRREGGEGREEKERARGREGGRKEKGARKEKRGSTCQHPQRSEGSNRLREHHEQRKIKGLEHHLRYFVPFGLTHIRSFQKNHGVFLGGGTHFRVKSGMEKLKKEINY
jgi:hypothetical protein